MPASTDTLTGMGTCALLPLATPPRRWMHLLAVLGVACRGPDRGPETKDPADDSGDTDRGGDSSDTSGEDSTADSTDTGEDSGLDSPGPRWSGQSPDEGYGTAINQGASGVFVGAPAFASGGLASGRLYLEGKLYAEGAPGDRLGAALAACGDGTLLIGAPGVDTVRDIHNEPLWTDPGAGGALACRGDAWATGSRTGATRWSGAEPTRVAWGAQPAALALLSDGRLVGGFPHGDVAVRVDDLVITRGAAADEAGYTVTVGDADGDGVEELLIGAPGAGRVYVLDPAHLPASLGEARSITAAGGRFGAALALPRPGLLFVGAPMAGGEVEGALWRSEGLAAPTLDATGQAAGDQLGFSLAVGADGTLLVGAPGASTVPGAVEIHAP